MAQKKKTKAQLKQEKERREREKHVIISKMQGAVLKYHDKIPLKTKTLVWKDIDTHSFFDMRVSTFNKKKDGIVIPNKVSKKEPKIIKCRKVILLPSSKQKMILLDMFEAYRIMYNETNRFIKKVLYDKNMKLPSWKKIRTDHLMDFKQKLVVKYNVNSHTLDGAIKLCYTSYKICFTNLRKGNITHFRVRYIKHDKDSKIIDIEKDCFTKFHLFKHYLKDPMENNENFYYSTIKCDSKMHYNANTDVFTLLVPETVNKNDVSKTNEYISIDPGLRTFLTCLSENKAVEIGRTVSSQLKELHTKIDNYTDVTKNESKLRNQIKKLKLGRLREKIKNKVKDMHWKVINYLKSFKNIIIGKWSTKDISSKKSSILNEMDKRVAQSLCFYQFLMRLEYKSHVNGNIVKIIKEHYTSQMCSTCGNLKKNLGGNKTYECDKCGLKIDRDMNSTRDILIKSFIV